MDSFTALFSALPVGLAVTDKTGRIVMTNPALDRLFGYAAGELAGRKMEALVPAHLACHHQALGAAYGARRRSARHARAAT